MRYLVTGVAGFIGSHLAKHLLENGHEVVGWDNFDSYYGSEAKRRNLQSFKGKIGSFTLFEKDLVSIEENDLEGIDCVFHLAGQPGVRSSWNEGFGDYLKNNVLLTQQLFEKNRGLRPIVYASSSSIYGNLPGQLCEDLQNLRPTSPYGISKATCELLASCYEQRFGGVYVGARLFTVYGPHQRPDMAFTRICSSILKKTPFPIFGVGDQVRDFTFIGDAVEALFRLSISEKSDIYNVGGGAGVSLKEAIRIFEDIAGQVCPVVFKPPVAGDIQQTRASISKIFQDFNWKPKISISEGVRLHWEWAMRNLVN